MSINRFVFIALILLWSCENGNSDKAVDEFSYTEYKVDSIRSVLTWVYSQENTKLDGTFLVTSGKFRNNRPELPTELVDGYLIFESEKIVSPDSLSFKSLSLFDSTYTKAKIIFSNVFIADTVKPRETTMKMATISFSDNRLKDLSIQDTVAIERKQDQLYMEAILSFPEPMESLEIGMFIYINPK